MKKLIIGFFALLATVAGFGQATQSPYFDPFPTTNSIPIFTRSIGGYPVFTPLLMPTCTGTVLTFNGTALSCVTAGGTFTLTTTGSSGAATYSGGVLNIPQYTAGSSFITSLTTTGTSGAATVNSGVLNIPNYVQGSVSYPGAGIVTSTGTAFGTSLAAPNGLIVGTTDTQTLTNKSIVATQLTGNVSTSVLGSGTPAAGSYVDGAAGAWTALPFKSLTTTGTSGAATLTGGVLNIPSYTGGSSYPDITDSAGTVGINNATVASATTLNVGTTGTTAAPALVFGNTVLPGEATFNCYHTATYCFNVVDDYQTLFSVQPGKVQFNVALDLNNEYINAGENNVAACTGTQTFYFSSAGNSCKLTGNVTFSTIAAPTSGGYYGQISTLDIIQTTGNSYTVTFPSNIGSIGGTVVTVTAGKSSLYTLQWLTAEGRAVLLSSVLNQ